MKILLTGFGSFTGIKQNPSQLIVEYFSANPMCGSDLIIKTAILPVEYEKTTRVMLSLLEKHSPDICLMIGVGGSKLELERVALNIDDSPKEDNAGLVIRGERIISDGPEAYFTDIKLVNLQKRLVSKGVKIEVSNYAGAYLCNHVYYITTHYSRTNELNFPTLFVHVPPLTPKENTPELPTWTLESLINATQTLIHELATS